MARLVRFGVVLSLISMFALAVWFRISSLDALPAVDGDEAWFAIQFTRLGRGESFEIRTPTGNLLSPLTAPIVVPLLRMFPNSIWPVRAASSFVGILAVVLTYVLGARLFGRTTALIAAALLAVLPYAVIQARTGYDCSHSPLYSILLLYFTFRTRTIGILLSLAALYLVHPFNLFILPLVLLVLLAQALGLTPGGRVESWRRSLLRMAAISGLGIGLGVLTLVQSRAQLGLEVYQIGPRGRHDWLHFWTLYGRLLLANGRELRQPHDWLIWTVLLGFVIFGLRRLARDRAWERVALVLGVFLSATALFVVGGSDIIQPGMVRWGWFLIVPSVLALACLVQGLMVVPETPGQGAVRGIQVASLLGLGGLLLFSIDLPRVDNNRTFDNGFGACAGESIWTFRTETKGPEQEAAHLIQQDVAERSAAKSTVVCEGVPLFFHFEFANLDRKDIEVRSGERFTLPANFVDLMHDGAYAVVRPGEWLECYLTSFLPADLFRCWDVRLGDERFARVYRLDHDLSTVAIPVPADYDGDGKTDQAVFYPATATWVIKQTRDGLKVQPFGPPCSIPVPADYDGDGKADLAIYHPTSATWALMQTSGGPRLLTFGPTFCMPVPADYDGDGKADLAVFESGSATWHLLQSTDGFRFQVFGAPIVDRPMPADYDGDGRTDLAVFRSTTGEWAIQQTTAGPRALTFSAPSLSWPVSADYDGDGKADPAVFDANSASWRVFQSTTGLRVQTADLPRLAIPKPGDYDGDGKADLVAFRPEWLGTRAPITGEALQNAFAKADLHPAPDGSITTQTEEPPPLRLGRKNP